MLEFFLNLVVELGGIVTDFLVWLFGWCYAMFGSNVNAVIAFILIVGIGVPFIRAMVSEVSVSRR
jgi:putative Mn2+ efflux pump MntP